MPRAYDVEAVRRAEFPRAAGGDHVYLDHASTGPLPARTVRTLGAWSDMRAAPWRISDDMEFDVMDRARSLAAQLVGAGSDEIALTTNTSQGINIAARCLPLHSGDVVVSSDREFPANVYPWMALAREGIVYERVPCTPAGLPDESALLAALDRPRVKVLAVSWVSFATGYACDLSTLGRACREREIYFVVDAIQGVGARTLDARACHIDVLACGGQKWLLSPWGTGFAYVRRELASHLEPRQVGWLAVQGSSDFNRLTEYDLSWYDDARRFEVGTLPYQDLAGFCASVEMLLEIGIGHIERHVGGLIDTMLSRLQTPVTPAEREKRAGILTVRVENAAAVADRLARAGIVCALREGAIRLSPHLYSTDDDIARAMDILMSS